MASWLVPMMVVFSMAAGRVAGGCCRYPGPPLSSLRGHTICVDTDETGCATFAGSSFEADTSEFVYGCTVMLDGVCKKTCRNGAACGDPDIVGFDGRRYMLWGQHDKTYDLLSERHHQVNVRLFDADRAKDPSSSKKHALWIDAVGIMIGDARIIVRMVRAADNVDEPELARVMRASLSATRPSTRAAKTLVAVAAFIAAPNVGTVMKKHSIWTGKPQQHSVDSHTSYTITDENHVVINSSQISLTVILQNWHHLDVHTTAIATSWGNVHGVMGQTYAAAFGKRTSSIATGVTRDRTAKSNAIASSYSLEGKEDDYITGGLLSADDKFTRFVVGSGELSSPVSAETSTGLRKMMVNTKGDVAVGKSVRIQDDYGRDHEVIHTVINCDAGWMTSFLY